MLESGSFCPALPGLEDVFLEGDMTVRKMVGVLPLMVVFALVRPLGAQIQTVHHWASDRPDARAPGRVTDDRTVGEGELDVAVRYLNLRMNSVGYGTDSLTVSQVWAAGYTVAPSTLVTSGFAVDLMYGVNDRLTVTASGSFARKKMEQWTASSANPGVYMFNQTESSGLMDIKLTGIYTAYEGTSARAYVLGGFSIPVGATDAKANAADPDNLAGEFVEVQLPYQQQLGSGTFDFLPGFNVAVQNEKATLGLQGKAVLHLGENSRGWSMGNTFTGNLWAGFAAADWAAVTIGFQYLKWGDIDGEDEDVDFLSTVYWNPAYVSYQKGWRLDLPLGVNFFMPENSFFAGQQLAIDFLIPIHQDLDQPQFRADNSIVVTWKKAFSF
ncbi:hypothetical protein ACFL5A_04150 [Gemmatimonadota bacterium]